jgi:hypothetical protein
MAVHIFRREATYYWRRRTPRSLAICLGRPHVFMSLRTTSPVMARRLATQLDAILEDAAMLAEDTNLDLSRSQIETMLGAVVERQLTKLERVAAAAKSAFGFDVDQARSDDKRALWTVRPEDRIRMAADGLSEADIEAVQRHLIMLRKNDMVPTKDHVLRQMIEGVEAAPTAMNVGVAQGDLLPRNEACARSNRPPLWRAACRGRRRRGSHTPFEERSTAAGFIA